LLSSAAIAFGDPSRIPFGFGLQGGRTVAIAPVDDVRSDLAFEANAKHLGTDAHALVVRSPVVRNARARFSLSFFFFSFFGAVGDSRRQCRRHAARCRRHARSGFPCLFPCPLVAPLCGALCAIRGVRIDRLYDDAFECGDYGPQDSAERHRRLPRCVDTSGRRAAALTSANRGFSVVPSLSVRPVAMNSEALGVDGARGFPCFGGLARDRGSGRSGRRGLRLLSEPSPGHARPSPAHRARLSEPQSTITRPCLRFESSRPHQNPANRLTLKHLRNRRKGEFATSLAPEFCLFVGYKVGYTRCEAGCFGSLSRTGFWSTRRQCAAQAW
jgi:hypothetical protein